MTPLLFLILVVLVLVAPVVEERTAPLPPVTDADLFQSMRQRLARGEPMSTGDIAYWADRYHARCLYFWTGRSFEEYLHAPMLVEDAARHEQQVLVFGAAARRTRVVRDGVLPPMLETLTRSRN
ncbi:MAG: hypothetical protein LCH53_06010 [Bacteroidetes bacterium]|nr:hypothetical protein [Bacteroidota bacterium]